MNPNTVKRKTITPYLVILGFIVAGYLAYLLATDRYIDLLIRVSRDPLFILNPKMLMERFDNEYFQIASILIAVSVHGLFYSVCTFVVLKLVASKLFIPKEKKLLIDRSGQQLSTTGLVEKAPLEIVPPVSPHGNAKAKPQPVPWHESYIGIEFALKPAGIDPYKDLFMAIYCFLEEHKKIPAAITSHHGEESLFSHSKNVTKKLTHLASANNFTDPLLEILGMAHDLNKVLSYKQKGEKWTKVCSHSHTYSYYVVNNFPEFWRLDSDDQKTIRYVLKYYHSPEELPNDRTPRSSQLINLLRKADGLTTAEEQDAVVISTPETSESLSQAFISGIRELDVNAYKRTSNRPFGWTKESYDFLAVTLDDFLNAAKPYLSDDEVKSLNLDRNNSQNRNHRELELIVDALSPKRLIILEKDGIKTETGTFIIKAGAKKFTNVILINKARLQEIMPDTVTKWGNSEFTVKIVKAFAPAG